VTTLGGVSDFTDLAASYVPLAQSVRRLIDTSIRSEVGADVVASAMAKIDAAADELSAIACDGSFGVRRAEDGTSVAWGNVAIGLRNPVAPPLTVNSCADGSVWTEFGATAHLPGRPAVTGTLTLRYLRGTRLGRPLRADARVDRVEGVKTFASGQIADAEGTTVQAEGIFIQPRNT
jgi:hypothetical protein